MNLSMGIVMMSVWMCQVTEAFDIAFIFPPYVSLSSDPNMGSISEMILAFHQSRIIGDGIGPNVDGDNPERAPGKCAI